MKTTNQYFDEYQKEKRNKKKYIRKCLVCKKEFVTSNKFNRIHAWCHRNNQELGRFAGNVVDVE